MRALGHEDTKSHPRWSRSCGAICHSLGRIETALGAHFELEAPRRGPYLYRWHLDEALRPAEEQLIASGDLPVAGRG